MGQMTSAMQELNGQPGAVQKLSYWHTMIVDWRLMNPSKNWSACAEFFQVSQAWLSKLINTDLFKQYYAARLEKHQELISKEIIAGAGEVALAGMQTLKARIEANGMAMPIEDLNATTEMAMKSLGYGAKGPAGGGGDPKVVINFGAIDREGLESARAKMRKVHEQNSAILNAEDAAEVPAVSLTQESVQETTDPLCDPLDEDVEPEYVTDARPAAPAPQTPDVKETDDDARESRAEDALLRRIFDEAQ